MENNELIKQEFDKLPIDIKEALTRADWRGGVQTIAKAHELDGVKTLSLETETMFILFGILSADGFLGNLQSEVGLDENTAIAIEKEIQEKVFAEVEKQYEMIEALMPKTAQQPVSTPTPAPALPPKPLEATGGAIVEAANNLPSVPAGSVPHVVEPGPFIPTDSTPEPKSTAPTSLQHTDDLNLIHDEPSGGANPAAPSASASSSYQSGKDPYREPIE